MTQQTSDQLRAELAAVNAANAALTRELERERARTEITDAGTPESGSPPAVRKGRGWPRATLAIALIAVGAILTPVSVVSHWAHQQLTDTSYFVDTFAPLAEKPSVQDFVAAQAVTAIESRIDIGQLADDLFAGLDELELGPRAKEALILLKAPAVSGVKGLIGKTVSEFVRSDAFATIWRDALTITHRQLVSTATGQKDAAITVGTDQEVSLQLGPIIHAVKQQLVADGFTLAERIPAISTTIVLAETSSIGIYLTIYQLVVAVGAWLPWISFILLAAGVLVARRRALALACASGAVLLSMVLVGNGIDIGRNVFALAMSSSIPQAAAIDLYAGALGFVTNMIVAMGVLGAAILAITLLAGPWRWARTLRGYGAAGISAIRSNAERHGITTGRAGEFLHRWRLPLRIVVGVLASAFLLLNRPVTPGMIIWTAIIGVVAVTILELASRLPQHASSTDTSRRKGTE